MKHTSLSIKLMLFFMLAPGFAAAQEGEWLVAPYLWTADVSWDLEARGSGGVAFSDLVDKHDGAGLIRIEYARNKIGFTLDYVGMSLSDRTTLTIPGPLPAGADIRASIDLTVFDVGTFYRPSAADSGVDFLAGIREVDVDTNLRVTILNQPTQRFDADKGFTDLYVGARYLHRLNQSWDFSVRGDYGFGGSEGSLNVMASVGWRTAGAFGMSLAYRHLAFEIDQRVQGEPVTGDFDFSGPALGFLFRF